MKRVALLLALLVCATRCGTKPCGAVSGSGDLGAFAVKLGQSVSLGGLCYDGPDPNAIPGPGPQEDALLGDAGTGICAAVADSSDPCEGCGARWCCAPAVTCLVDDPVCNCLVTCRQAGGTAETCAAPSACGAAPGAAYLALATCAVARCATECPRLVP